MDLGHLGEVFEELVSSNITTSNKLVMELAWDELDKDKPASVHPQCPNPDHIDVLCNTEFNPPIRLRFQQDSDNVDAASRVASQKPIIILSLVNDGQGEERLQRCTQCKQDEPMLTVADEKVSYSPSTATVYFRRSINDGSLLLRPRIRCNHGNKRYRDRRAASPWSIGLVDGLPTQEPEAPNPLSIALSSALQNPIFSDISFVVEDRMIPAHKIILASRSEYFRTLLCCNMREATQAHPVVPLHDISYTLFYNILAYVYSDKMDIDADNVMNIITAADRFRLDDLKERCEKFLITSHALDEANVSSILRVADMYSCALLKRECISFILGNFYEIEKMPQFAENLKDLIPTFSSIYEEKIKQVMSGTGKQTEVHTGSASVSTSGSKQSNNNNSNPNSGHNADAIATRTSNNRNIIYNYLNNNNAVNNSNNLTRSNNINNPVKNNTNSDSSNSSNNNSNNNNNNNNNSNSNNNNSNNNNNNSNNRTFSAAGNMANSGSQHNHSENGSINAISPNNTATDASEGSAGSTTSPPSVIIKRPNLVLRRFSGPCSLRIRNDIKEFLLKPISNIRMYWTAGGTSLTVSVKIPGDPLWGDGWYYFRMMFGIDFPMEPPTIKFVSTIFHPNVYSDGTAKIDLIQRESWSAITSISCIAATVRENIFINPPRGDLIANFYAWHLYTTDRPKYNQIIQDYNFQFGSNKRYQDVQYSPDSAKKQKTIEEEIDTEELYHFKKPVPAPRYVSDQTFWMWGAEKEESEVVEETSTTVENEDLNLHEGINLMLMHDQENDTEGAMDFLV